MIEVGDLVKVKNEYCQNKSAEYAKIYANRCWLVVETKKIDYMIDVVLITKGSKKEWISMKALEKL
jgi:hypothetical protein